MHPFFSFYSVIISQRNKKINFRNKWHCNHLQLGPHCESSALGCMFLRRLGKHLLHHDHVTFAHLPWNIRVDHSFDNTIRLHFTLNMFEYLVFHVFCKLILMTKTNLSDISCQSILITGKHDYWIHLSQLSVCSDDDWFWLLMQVTHFTILHRRLAKIIVPIKATPWYPLIHTVNAFTICFSI